MRQASSPVTLVPSFLTLTPLFGKRDRRRKHQNLKQENSKQFSRCANDTHASPLLYSTEEKLGGITGGYNRGVRKFFSEGDKVSSAALPR